MLTLRDLFQMRQAEPVLSEVVMAGPGLIIVSGPEGQPAVQGGEGQFSPGSLLPSGRSMVFRTLVDEILDQHPDSFGILVSSGIQQYRSGKAGRRRLRELEVNSNHTYAEQILEAAVRNPSVVLVDRLDEQTVLPILEIARRGQRVVAQLDSPLRGRSVVQHLLDLGASVDLSQAVTWVVAVQRLPTLCVECRRAVLPSAVDLIHLERLLQILAASGAPVDPIPEELSVADAPGCRKCRFSGRMGDVSVVDIVRVDSGLVISRLPLEACVWGLIQRGLLPLRDLLHFDQDLLSRLFKMQSTAERRLVEVQGALERSRSELEAANRVLEHRNQALFFIQDIGDALIRSVDLYDLADRVCRRAGELCEADRSVLYYLHPDETIEIAAVTGWEGNLVHNLIDGRQIFRPRQSDALQPFRGIPPGIASGKAAEHGAGLFVPLVVQGERVGAMIVQSTLRAQFKPGEIAILQAFANQAALALQRAGLVEDLRQKVAALEAAQVALAEKERMQRELELARQVQLSALPHAFPEIPGYRFAARLETARQVGGDFYDVISLDEDHFAIAIADVSDKGMPAALYMALTRSLLVAQARRERGPCAVLQEVNHLLQMLTTARMFVTIFYGVVNRRTGQLCYARAGHNRPVLIRQGNSQELGGNGIALGVLEAGSFSVEEHEIQLVPGDRLILYTDGLTDVFAPDEELFGREQLIHLLAASSHLESTEFCQRVFSALLDYQAGAEQFDDMTMLVIELTPSP
jgi:phosphoserine phosphatase RsbU/P